MDAVASFDGVVADNHLIPREPQDFGGFGTSPAFAELGHLGHGGLN